MRKPHAVAFFAQDGSGHPGDVCFGGYRPPRTSCGVPCGPCVAIAAGYAGLHESGQKWMKTSTDRILTTHVGSIPRPESIRALVRARLAGQPIEEAELAARVGEAVTEVVHRQAAVGLDVVSDGEMSKTSFLAYTDDRLTGFATTTAATDPSAALTGAGALGTAGGQPEGVARFP
jgi:hypothetical protein